MLKHFTTATFWQNRKVESEQKPEFKSTCVPWVQSCLKKQEDICTHVTSPLLKMNAFLRPS